MAQWVQQKYIGILSNKFQRFKQIGQNYNLRCMYCGDSKKSKLKARGWFLLKDAKYCFYCHNCGITVSFRDFIKDQDPSLYQEYLRDEFMEKNLHTPPSIKNDVWSVEKSKFIKDSPLSQLKKISSLAPEHGAKKYVVARKIPNSFHHKLFYTPKFKTWVNSFIPGKFENIAKDEPRLVIPFIDKDGEFFGCQGRAFNDIGVRYISIIADPEKPRLFGLDMVDFKKTVYAFEGPIDSMFITNSIALCGSEIENSLYDMKDNLIIVYDNEPRSKEICGKIEKAINHGFKVSIWPETMEHKDVNKMILSGYTPKDIRNCINDNTFVGMQAKLRLEQWRKCK